MGLGADDGPLLGPKFDLDPIDRMRSREAIVRRMFGGPPSPIRVGRYEITRAIGVGAMGRVYLAEDPRLGRAVALKFLHVPEAVGALISREAQVLARLSHPNVVRVYDAGQFAGRRFVAMEYVEGLSLRDWLRAISPSPHKIVDAFVQLARGLAAAHDLGIVHRDVKPENILCGRDERVRVADFGLASTTPSGRAGTPAYFAPELAAGHAATPASDQFAFFVSLYEALAGARPPDGDAGVCARPPARPRLPGVSRSTWVAIRRGLEPRPERRFAAMADVERALSRGRGTRRLSAIGVGAAAAIALVTLRRAPASCATRGADRLAEVWNESRRDGVARGEARQTASGESVGTGFTTEFLDRLGAEWLDVYGTACASAPIERGPVMTCLDEHARSMELVVVELLHEDEAGWRDAPLTVARLRPPGECLTARRSTPLSPSVARALERSRELAHDGHHAAAVRALADVADPSSEVAAVVAYERGRALSGAGDYTEAAAEFERALFGASAAADDVQAFRAATELVDVTGYRLGRTEDARRWTRQAEALLLRLGAPARLRAELETTAGLNEFAAGHFVEARDHYDAAEEALASISATRIDLAYVAARQGTVHFELGEFEAALGFLDRAAAIRAEIFGPRHPMIAEVALNRAAVLLSLGRNEEALSEYRRSAELFEETFGAEHTVLVAVELNIGNVHADAKRYEEALLHYRRALAIARETLGDTHPNVATVLDNAGTALRHLGRFDDARSWMVEALEIRTIALGPEHLDLAYSHSNLANLEMEAGDAAAARPHFDRAVELFERELGLDHPASRTSRENRDAAFP
ncbi:MAG: serine/threonine-protein kinase [Myxococcota bacterium]